MLQMKRSVCTIVLIICCLGQESKDVMEQLMDLMRFQLMSVIPDDRESFIELCLKKRMECSEVQFSGNKAVFTWRPGILSETKDRFWRTYDCVYSKNINKCPVDGGWTEWSMWSKCTADCEDKGWQTRTRACENPKPAHGGNQCEGEKLTNKTCIGKCRTSSDGLAEAEEYLVQAHDAFPALAGLCMEKHCMYSDVLKIMKDRSKVDKYWSSMNCVKFGSACPINGGWSNWVDYSTPCSTECGIGEKYRIRKCDNPATKNGGIPCQGEWLEKSTCVEKKCSGESQKDLGLTEWSEFSECSVKCGKYGEKTSSRYCLRDKCLLEYKVTTEITRVVPCYGGECPQTGGWGQWQAWTECSAECGVGRKTRFRQCDSPYPSGGENCFGMRVQTTACDGSLCIQLPQEDKDDARRKREAMTLKSSFKIIASLVQSIHVQTSQAISAHTGQVIHALAVHSPLKASFYNQMKHTVDNSRALIFIPPTNVQKSPFDWNCVSSSLSNKKAVTIRNESNGTTVNCNIPLDSRLRRKREVKVESDDPYNFELNPGLENTYTSWTMWSHCSATCGGGTRKRTRSCKDKTIVCRGEIIPIQFCNLDPCPAQGGWGAWQSWTPCTVTCGSGKTERYRACDNPLPAFGGSCPGSNQETRECTLSPCRPGLFTGSSWSLWTACSKTCGGGTYKRTAFMYLLFGTQPLTREEKRICNIQPCPGNGLWAAWEGWTPCSEPCGIGNRVRDRTCSDPAPHWGGTPCEGDGSEMQTCFSGPCLDEDDYGIQLEGNSFMRYPEQGKATGLFMFFIRLKPAALSGTIFHQTRQCKTKLTDCECSIMLTMTNGMLDLEVKREKKTLKLSYTNPLVIDKWQDILVVVTESWAEMRVDDDYKADKTFSPGSFHTFNFDGEITVGNDRLQTSGFQGKIGALRKNFKILVMFNTKSWSGYAVPSVIHNAKKIQMKSTVRHPNFKGKFYSHLFFQENHYFHLTASFLITYTKGLILFNGGVEPNSFISVALVDASLQFCLSCGSRPICHKGYEMKTDEWYVLRVVAKENEGQVRLNEGDAIQINCPSGEKYRPRSTVYIGGAGDKDWAIIVEATSNQSMFHGHIDTLTINDLTVTYKMATLVDVSGMLNSLGYSLSDYVTEVYKNDKTITTLLCGVPEKAAKSHFVRIVWFENMRRLVPAAGVEIIHATSDTEIVSKVNLYPEHNREGIYACVVSQDGMLSVVHIFVVFRYKAYKGHREKRKIGVKDADEYEVIEELNSNNQETVTANKKVVNTEDESELQAEWIVLIVILVLILLCFCPGLCYCCTKDHPIWAKPREICHQSYCKLTGQKYIEEQEGMISESEPGESGDEEFLSSSSPQFGLSDTSKGPTAENIPLKLVKMQSQLKNQSSPQMLSAAQSSSLQQGQPLSNAQYAYMQQDQPLYNAQYAYMQQGQPMSNAQYASLQQGQPMSGTQSDTYQQDQSGSRQQLQNQAQQQQLSSQLQPPTVSDQLMPVTAKMTPQALSQNVQTMPGTNHPYCPPGYHPQPYGVSLSSSQSYYSPHLCPSLSRQICSPFNQNPSLNRQISPPSRPQLFRPQYTYNRPSLQRSISKLHIVPPSVSRDKISGTLLPPQSVQQDRMGRMFICQSSNLDSLKKGREFKCRVAQAGTGNAGPSGNTLRDTSHGFYDQQSHQPSSFFDNSPSGYCEPGPCSFIDQISVQLPPQRTFKANATYPQTPCYYPHFPCRPSFNPYALCNPYNMNSVIPPIDLLYNPFMMTPFRKPDSEPTIETDVMDNRKKPVSNKDQADFVLKQGSSREFFQDQLNFSDNNSIAIRGSPLKKPNKLFLEYNTKMPTTDCESLNDT